MAISFKMPVAILIAKNARNNLCHARGEKRIFLPVTKKIPVTKNKNVALDKRTSHAIFGEIFFLLHLRRGPLFHRDFVRIILLPVTFCVYPWHCSNARDTLKSPWQVLKKWKSHGQKVSQGKKTVVEFLYNFCCKIKLNFSC